MADRSFPVLATVQGVSALLMRRYSEENEVEHETRAVKLEQLTPAQAAERTAYRLPSGQLYIPGAAIHRLLREAGTGHRQRGTRRSVKYVVPAAVGGIQDQIPLHDGAGEPLTRIEVDSRPVTIPATKGRIMRHRARVEEWQATFTLEIEQTVLDADTIHQLLEEGGRRIGILDYRPEKGGPFGRFAIIRWEPIHDD